jgi:hypothetical protein
LLHALTTYGGELPRFEIISRGHTGTLRDVPRGEKIVFVVRDPVSRFVSAFNGRLREDRPRYHYPWREEERIAFGIFKTPDELARALSSDDAEEQRQAEEAMGGIGHLNTPYSYWLGDEQRLLSRLPDLFFIGLQERLNQDFELLKRKLDLPPEAHLPSDETAAHRSPPELDRHLSEVARANLERWYADDIAMVRLCRELAPRVNAAG